MVVRRFCDLNVQESSSYVDNLENIKQLVSLGYTVVALNRHYGLPKKEKEKNKRSPNEISTAEEAKKFVAQAKQLHDRLKADIEKLRSNQVGQSKSNTENDLVIPEKFQLLSRLTFDLDHVDQLSYLRSHSNKTIMAAFDVIAVNPKCEKCFRSLMEGKLDFDIVSFTMADRLPFRLDHHQVGLGTSKGLVFEIAYTTAIKSQSLRKYVFSNSQNLTSKTKHGKGIIITSGGESKMDFRAPSDVANLSNLFGLKGSFGLDAVSNTAMKAVTHALLRRDTFKGAVKVEYVGENTCEGEIKNEEGPPKKKMKV